jgi:hypothetical protein
MKLLVLYQAHDVGRDQPGYHDGFNRLVGEGLVEAHHAIPWAGVVVDRGWGGLWQQVLDTARERDVDAVFLQFFHGRMPDPAPALERLRALTNGPVIFTSLGDPYGQWTNRVSAEFRAASRLSEVTFLTGMGYLAGQLVRAGSKNVVLMPHGCCQVRFAGAGDRDGYRPEFDAVFIGSRMSAPNPLGHFARVGRRRDEFVRAFTKRFGPRFGLFGSGWEGNPSWQGPIAYAAQHETMRRGRVVLGGMPNAYYAYYTSDREFIALASGVPFVDYREQGLNRLFREGSEWWLAENAAGMMAHVDGLLRRPESERWQSAARTRELVLGGHTQYHRCREMVEIVGAVRRARRAGGRAAAPRLGFFRAEEEPAPAAVLGWVG